MKKLIATSILLGLMTMTFAPVFAIDEANQQTVVQKQQKSVKKSKKNKDTSYRYEYVNQGWWKNFNDENLNKYISKAIDNNYDLKMATSAVEEYYQQMKLSFANELPKAGVGFAPNWVKLPGSTGLESVFAMPAIVQYEADIFLKNRDKTKSVKKLWEGSKLDERSAYISVASAVGTVYLNIVCLNKTIEIQEEIVKNRKMIYELMTLRNKEGITSTADMVRANKAYIAGSRDLIELKKQRNILLHQLCVLIGESPENADTLAITPFDKIKFSGTIPAEVASEIIVQRPDYLKAEKMVEKAGIDVRVAKKEFLPTINLNGLAVFNANQLGSLFTTSNVLGALGGMIAWPVFTGGARVYNLRLKKAAYERVLSNYYKTNLTAIQEVNDSLVSIKMDQQKFDETKRQRELERADFGYNEQRFEQGTISKLDLIQMKENLLLTDKILAMNKIECYTDYIGLYKAVGSKLQ